jgi:hypothetical protein
MGEIRQILRKKKKILFVFKGYTCRFKSEAFASVASIALLPCGMTVVFVIPKKLECLQLEAARIVTDLPIYSSAESLYFETGWSKLEDRRKSRKLNLFYKIENNMAPTYLSDYYWRNSNI